MPEKKKIEGFLHFRTDLGDGVRTGVVFSDCREDCGGFCSDFRFITEHGFAEDTLEQPEYSSEELLRYLLEEKTLYYAKKLGITFLGREPLRDPFFCTEVARGLREAGIGLQIYTCAMCSHTSFEMLDGLVELYVLRAFPPFFSDDLNAVFDRNEHLRQVVSFLEHRRTPYRILIPCSDTLSKSDTERFADYLQNLHSLKSVILDFSASVLTLDEQTELKKIFLYRKIPLY